MRARITFAKTEQMRFTGHLDLYRAWERLLRRAGLPLAYSQGFKPHPRIVLAAALPLGFTSECELADVWLEEDFSLVEVRSALEEVSPPGLRVLSVSAADPKAPSLPASVRSAEYRILLSPSLTNISQRIESLLSANDLPSVRRGKAYDMRPLIEYLSLAEDNGRQVLLARLAAREGATGRPEEMVAALGGAPDQTRFHRTRLFFTDPPSQE
jgi:radical SAM-linked protein